MLCVYIGWAGDVQAELMKAYTGDVTSSELRRQFAVALGYQPEQSDEGEWALSSDVAEAKQAENRITLYILSGHWHYVVCETEDQARGFCHYATMKLLPLLDKPCIAWDESKLQQYERLLNQLQAAPLLRSNQIDSGPAGPGVYAFRHDEMPAEYATSEE